MTGFESGPYLSPDSLPYSTMLGVQARNQQEGVGMEPEIEKAMEEVRTNIRRIRQEKGMSAKNVADLMGISRPFYTQLEGGKRRLSLRYMIGIAKALKVKPGELY